MNAKQRTIWEELVQQCESRSYNSINVASKIRSDAIIAASALVGLVNEETAMLLEKLASHTRARADSHANPLSVYVNLWHRDAAAALKLAAQIREALDDSQA